MKMLGSKTNHHQADDGEDYKPKRAIKREERIEWMQEEFCVFLEGYENTGEPFEPPADYVAPSFVSSKGFIMTVEKQSKNLRKRKPRKNR